MSGVLTGREANSARSQINVLRYLAGHVEAHGYAPSVRSIAAALGRASFGGVHGDLEDLTDQGLIKRLRYRACAIKVLEPVAVPRAPDLAPCHFIPADSIVRRLEQLHPRRAA
jgi:SOS-response transcriptional repressor LexA